MQIPNYQIQEQIGQGGMATVYRARHTLLEQDRAIKLMSPELCAKPGVKGSFIREAQIIAGLTHPNIVTIFDIGQCGDSYYMAMEYLRGGSLSDKLKKGPLPLEQSLQVLRDIGAALQHAHKGGFIHRDIKPANILFNDKNHAMLTDFGISKLQGTQSELTQMGYGLIGTPRYMSPEQTGGHSLDQRSDIYSLGLVFYEMLTGRFAIDGDTTPEIIRSHALSPPPVLPAALAVFQPALDKALAKTSAERYASVQAFVEDVSRSAPVGYDKTVVSPAAVETIRQRRSGQAAPADHADKADRVGQWSGARTVFVGLLLTVLAGLAWLTFDRLGDASSGSGDAQIVAPNSDNASVNTKSNQVGGQGAGDAIALDRGITADPATGRMPASAEPKRDNERLPGTVSLGKDTTANLPGPADDVAARNNPGTATQPFPQADRQQTDFTVVELSPVRMTVRVAPYAILYAEPGMRRIAQLAQNAEVRVSGTARAKDGSEWKRVDYDGAYGYVKASHLSPP